LLPTKEEDFAVVKLTQKALNDIKLHGIRRTSKEDEIAVVKLLRHKNSSDRIICPRCGGEAVLLRTINRYYCFHCRRYI